MASASAHESVPPDAVRRSAANANDASPVVKVPANESEVDRSRRQTRLIKSCGDNYLKALELLETFKSRSSADLFAFHAVIGVCSRAKQPAAAVDVLNSMSPYGVEPDARLYRAVFDGIRNAGQWKRSLGLLRTMERSGEGSDDDDDNSSGKGLLPDLYAYNSSLLALARAGEWKPVLELLDKMESAPAERKLTPNAMSFGAAVSTCAAAKQWKLCWQLVGAMDERGVQPNAAFYAALLGACNRSGQWAKALACYSRMQARAGPPHNQAIAMDAAVLRSVLQACIEGKQPAQAEMALQHAVRDGVLLDLPLVDFALAALTNGKEGGLQKGMGRRRLPNSTAPADGESAALGDGKVALMEDTATRGAQRKDSQGSDTASSSSTNGTDTDESDAEARSPYAARIEELRTLKTYLANRAENPETDGQSKKGKSTKNASKKGPSKKPVPSKDSQQEQLEK